MRVLLLLLLCLCNAAHAAQFTAKVIAVLDGDTVLIKRDKTLSKIRLAEIDAPEKDQPYGMASKQSLSDMVLGKDVRISSRAVDDYGRTVANLQLGELDVNAEQLRRGLAWEYSNYHSNKAYVALQKEAQQAHRGLWAQASVIQPSQWRKTHATAQPAKHPARDYACGSKQRCAQMSSCDEAVFYLQHCGIKTLDNDGDGKPCESLCAEEATNHKAAGKR